jgi:predicted nucleic acid-binding protein
MLMNRTPALVRALIVSLAAVLVILATASSVPSDGSSPIGTYHYDNALNNAPASPVGMSPPSATARVLGGEREVTHSAEPSAGRLVVAAETAGGTGSAALDTNVLIRGLDNGELGAVDKALAGRLPNVSPTAASEYLVRGSQETLDQFLAERGGSIGLAGTQEGAAALQAQAAGLGRALGLNDALIAHSAMQEGIPLITGDSQLLRFLNAIGYPAEGF